MLSPEEQAIITRAKELGKTREEALAGIEKYRASKQVQPTEQKGFVSNVVNDIKNRGANVANEIGNTQQNPILSGVKATAQAFGGVADVGTEAIKSIPGGETALNTIGKGFNFLTDKIASTKLFSDIGNLEAQGHINPKDNPEFYALKSILEGAQASGEIASTIAGAQGTASSLNSVKNGVVNTATKTGSVIKNTARSTEGLITRSKELVNPSPTALEATGEILQGKTTDVAPAIKALSAVDTKGVKTNIQLKGKIEDAISKLSKEVDTELAKDTNVTLLDDLKTTIKTKTGQVSRNYVKDALDHLKELYTSTADDVSLSDVNGLIEKAKTTGLTKLEVNDISRIYGQEFGEKAFNKLGDPLTSVNAQMFENIRKGLKNTARSGIGGEAARKADSVVSTLYNTKRLVAKNVEAVQKLQQRIAERGLLEKAGHAVSKYADILTGGTIRGLVGGLLPRGAGYKVLNALDLEKRLERNLKIIKEASKSGNEADILKLLKELEN